MGEGDVNDSVIDIDDCRLPTSPSSPVRLYNISRVPRREEQAGGFFDLGEEVGGGEKSFRGGSSRRARGEGGSC